MYIRDRDNHDIYTLMWVDTAVVVVAAEAAAASVQNSNVIPLLRLLGKILYFKRHISKERAKRFVKEKKKKKREKMLFRWV